MEGMDLFGLIYSSYIPGLSMYKSNPQCNKILSEREMPLDELLQLKDENIAMNFAEEHQEKASLCLIARIAYAALQSSPFNSESANLFAVHMNHLSSYDSSYSISKDALELSSKLISGSFKAESITDLNYLYELFSQIKGFINNADICEKTFQDRYTYLINAAQKDITLENARNLLLGIIKMNSLDISFDYEKYKTISAALGIAVFYQEQRTEAEKKELLGLLLSMECQNDTMKQSIEDMSQDYSPDEISLQKLADIPQLNIIQKDNLPPSRPTVYRRDQLTFDPLSIHSNTSGRVHMHIWKGSFTHQGVIYPVAVKEYYANSQEELNTFERQEYTILEFLSEKKDCFLHCYGCYHYMSGDRFCFGIVMELCQMTLMNYIDERKAKNEPFTETELQQMVYKLLEGFEFMTHYKIYHYDIKPHNIFLNEDLTVKIADFNVAKKFEDNQNLTTLPAAENSLQGTDGYMPPELQRYVDERRLGEISAPLLYRASKVDIYSLGLTFLQLYTLNSVYGLNRPQNQNALIQRLDRIEILWLKNLLEQMLVFDFNERKSMKQLLAYLPSISTMFTTILQN